MYVTIHGIKNSYVMQIQTAFEVATLQVLYAMISILATL